MPPNAKTDPSLGHLPDLSDASISFQIPADSSSAEFLLADNSGDREFLRGAGGASFATIAPTPARGRLKLSDFTPKVESRLLLPQSPSPGPSTHQRNDSRPLRSRYQSPIKTKKTPRAPYRHKELVLDEPTISEERLEFLRAEVETLNDDYDIPTNVEPPAVAQFSVIPMLKNTAVTGPTVKPRSIRANPTIEGGRNAKHTARSRIPVSADGKLHTAEPTVQSSSTCSSVEGSMLIDAEVQVPPAGTGVNNIMTSDTSRNVRLSTGGMAERLVSYSQIFMSSIGIYQSKSENSFVADTGAVVAKTDEKTETQPSPTVRVGHPRSPLDPQSGNGYPLRLSDISPQKREAETDASPGHLSIGRRELSPMRPASKRPATEEDPPSHQRGGSKRGKPLSQRTEVKRVPSISAGPASQVLQPCTEKNHAHSAPIYRDSRWPTSNFPSARTKYKPKFNSYHNGPSGSTAPRVWSHEIKSTNKEKGKNAKKREAVSTGRTLPSQSRVSGTSRVHSDETKVDEKKPMILERSGPSRAGLVSSVEKMGITLPSANLTKPVAFTFRLDARIEARKEEKTVASEQGRTESMHRHRHTIPDFKALHEAHQASIACRKHVVPIAPAPPIMLNTEIRARERERFDEMVRMKEEELEREKEERRKQQEAEEEMEIRELRRRAIPKANEIPEWYAEMPKKGGGVRGSG
ncbi:hypothetical protein K503DRAFT_768061 [Rhizopogon vinicolor AM-OR11-026]|uniref:TPX2 C-terminal domain-containing protein n=1 Tax=Rhizopogon vinicolor AM-OR11-026 TaxID=1314800 RepID=A0A1B7N815_9AGAM|nr:hypothetical protein K503DRAFT_768061 [Rhizopogon vinicolor AM-OR11-026]